MIYGMKEDEYVKVLKVTFFSDNVKQAVIELLT